MRSSLAVLAATIMLAAPLAARGADVPSFDYKREVTNCTVSRTDAGPTIVFRGPGEKETSGVLVMPPGLPVRSIPAVLWVHWLGEPATTNHTEFVSDARALAKRGAVSLLLDMPWSQKGWFSTLRAPETDYTDTIAQVIALRRGLDCLSQMYRVDQSRMAFVGHDFGAMDGALLLAVDDRPQYAVLMTPTLSYWQWYLLGKAPADPAAYVAQMSVFDLPGWLARGKQKATLLQFGTNDEYVAQATGIALRNSVPDRNRTFKAYRLDHSLDDETAHTDRITWLAQQLGI